MAEAESENSSDFFEDPNTMLLQEFEIRMGKLFTKFLEGEPFKTAIEEGLGNAIARENQEIEELKRKNLRLEDEKQSLKTTIDMLEHSLSLVSDVSNAEALKLKEQIKQLQMDMEQKREEIKTLKSQIEKKQAMVESMKANVTKEKKKLEKALDEKQKEIDALEHKRTQEQEKLNAKISARDEELKKVKKEANIKVEQINEQMLEIENKKKNLEEQLSKEKGIKQVLRSRLAILLYKNKTKDEK